MPIITELNTLSITKDSFWGASGFLIIKNILLLINFLSLVPDLNCRLPELYLSQEAVICLKLLPLRLAICMELFQLRLLSCLISVTQLLSGLIYFLKINSLLVGFSLQLFLSSDAVDQLMKRGSC